MGNMSSYKKNPEMITEESIKNMYVQTSDIKPKLKKNNSSILNINDIIVKYANNKSEINKNNKINKINYKNIIIILIILIVLIALIIFIVLYILENKKYNECELKYNEYKKQLK